MIRIFLAALLLICTACNEVPKYTEVKKTDMILKDGKYISPRQMRAVTGD